MVCISVLATIKLLSWVKILPGEDTKCNECTDFEIEQMKKPLRHRVASNGIWNIIIHFLVPYYLYRNLLDVLLLSGRVLVQKKWSKEWPISGGY
jgi:hypothetical protein